MKLFVPSDEEMQIGDRRRKASQLYRSQRGKDWQYSNTAIVYREVNTLKHKEAGTWTGRTVPFPTAIRAVRENLDVLEAWADAKNL